MSTALITGANRGIGLELARQLKQAGHDVIACCRRASNALAKLEVRVEENVDVTSQQSLDALRAKLGTTQLDLLINNAGILRSTSLDNPDYDAMREQFEVNSLGPLRTTLTLLPLLKAGSKVAIVTSRMGSVTDNTSGGSYGYRMSKAAVNMAGASLAHDLAARAIAVAILHPGYVRTDMTHQSGLIDADESARGLIERINDLSLENTGTFWHQNGDRLPW